MKKIKKKKPASSHSSPDFIVGWTSDDPPPPGFLSAWFDRHYGGPLSIRLLDATGYHRFEASHTSWSARVELLPPEDQQRLWQSTLQWEHAHLAFVGGGGSSGADRRNVVLHRSRLARGLTMLTEGTTYDMATGQYLNPSDWRDRDLAGFVLSDHVQVERQDRLEEGLVRLHTRGLAKFGLDDLESFLGVGLTDQECERRLLETAEAIIRENRNLKNGELLEIPGEAFRATVVRHRTDSTYGRPLPYREVTFT